MKKSILIPFLFMGLLAFASCKGTSENKSTTATDTVQAEKPQSGTIHLTRAEFLKKIADYENHSKEWKIWVTNRLLSTSTPTGAVPAKWWPRYLKNYPKSMPERFISIK